MNENKNALENGWVDPDDAPELTDAFFDQATPKINDEVVSISDVEAAFKKRVGRPRATNPKKPISIRLSADVLEYFKSTGGGWQTRVDDILREYMAVQQRLPTG